MNKTNRDKLAKALIATGLLLPGIFGYSVLAAPQDSASSAPDGVAAASYTAPAPASDLMESNNPFYQIYVMDLATGSSQKVSPGVGLTTCAWIHPSRDLVMFSSTHEDPDARGDRDARHGAP